MEVDVYADLLFLINAGMDGLCLCMTARLLHRRPRLGRLILAAAVGGVYAVVALLAEVVQAVALGMDLAVCVAMCALAFGWRDGRGRRGLLAATAVYAALSMVMGGVMTALFNLFNRAGLAAHLPSGGEGIGAWLFLVFSVAGSVISMRGGRFLRRSTTVGLCRVTVECDGAILSFRGLTDSGNFLRDPMGGHPVICISAEAMLPLLSPPLQAFMRSGGTDISGLTAPADIKRTRLIPAGTVTGGGILPGLRPDKIILTPEGGRPREVDAILALTPTPPTGTHGMGDIDALIPAELL